MPALLARVAVIPRPRNVNSELLLQQQMLENTYCHSSLGISQWGCLAPAVGGGRPGAGMKLIFVLFVDIFGGLKPGKEPTAVALGLLLQLHQPHNQDKPKQHSRSLLARVGKVPVAQGRH